MVTSIPIPRFKDLHINSIHIRNCSLEFNGGDESLDNGLGVAIINGVLRWYLIWHI